MDVEVGIVMLLYCCVNVSEQTIGIFYTLDSKSVLNSYIITSNNNRQLRHIDENVFTLHVMRSFVNRKLDYRYQGVTTYT